MTEVGVIGRFFEFVWNFLGLKPRTMFISVKTETGWERKAVDSPITFSELDKRFGEGNWKLI